MVAIKGHFDGKVIVPDEPHDLRPGQTVIVQAEPAVQADDKLQHPTRKAGSAKGKIWMADDFDAPLEDFKDYM
ncbi:hypothetical protein BH10PLA1_BH10PLA1_23290 [soil metagenome]